MIAETVLTAVKFAANGVPSNTPYGVVVCAVDSSTAITPGDLLYLDTDDVKPAASQADQSSETNNQVLFASRFMGVAIDGHTANSGASTIRVATRGSYTCSCASNTFEVGDLIGTYEQSNGTQLYNQSVTKVNSTDLAIGRCNTRSATATTSVTFEIQSYVMTGGVMPPA